ncbi:MAG: pilus assembly protein [Lachnospiraceae bacterium]|nr:pilus assembly protein [Lachnospiraceae bacterium]
MLKRILKRLKEKCGAATIEAVVAFTGFLFVIVTILNVANYCRAQMVISNAVDAAARELAQYSYFYNMSGMEKFNNYVNENAGAGAANINDVIDGTNSVYTTLSGALSDTTDYGNHLADKVDNQSLNYQDIQTAVLKIDTNSSNIMTSINSMEAKFNAVERNPLLYMKSLAAVASGEALDLAKSYVIAAPLAKLFTSANINSGEISVQQYLENLGIVGGFEGLNFNTSTMFSPGEQDEIHLRCYYKISLCNFVDKSLFEIPICKESYCRAWLGGDDNPVKVSQQAAVQPAPERTMPEQADASSNDVVDGDVSGSDVSGSDVSGGDPSYEELMLLLSLTGDERIDEAEFFNLVHELRNGGHTPEEKEKLLRDYVQRFNYAGANEDLAKDIYTLALQTGVDIDKLDLKKPSGENWTEADLYGIIGGTVKDYPSFKEAVAFYTLNQGLSDEEKVAKVLELYKHMNDKDKYMVPADARYIVGINLEDGSFIYNWPENEGFAPGFHGISVADLPKDWDRYGDLSGKNFSSIDGSEPYTWDQRALPYKENPNSYHHGTMDGDFYCELIDSLVDPGRTEADFNAVIEKYTGKPATGTEYDTMVQQYMNYLDNVKKNYYPLPDDYKYGLVGRVQPAFESEGTTGEMATQYTIPFTVNTLIETGVIKEDKTGPK